MGVILVLPYEYIEPGLNDGICTGCYFSPLPLTPLFFFSLFNLQVFVGSHTYMLASILNVKLPSVSTYIGRQQW